MTTPDKRALPHSGGGLTSVQVEIGSPDPGAPNRGKLQVSVECSPVASPEYQGRGGEEWGAEMAHAVQAALLGGGGGGGGVDLSSLCILAGKTCWLVYVDALVLNNDGNVLSAVSLAAHAALVDTRVPRVEVVADEEGGGPPEIELDDGASCGLALDASRLPVVVTVSQVGSATVLDMDGAEEGCAEASAHIAVMCYMPLARLSGSASGRGAF